MVRFTMKSYGYNDTDVCEYRVKVIKGVPALLKEW